MSIRSVLLSCAVVVPLILSPNVHSRTLDGSKLDGSKASELSGSKASELSGSNAPSSAEEAKARRLAKRALKHYRKKTKKLMADVAKNFKSATSSGYVKDYLKEMSEENVSAKDAAYLTIKAYNLAGNAGLFDYDNLQDEVSAIKLTMENAEDLAETNEDGDALDIATLRCSQNTEDAALGMLSYHLDDAYVASYKAAKKELCSVVMILADLRYKRQQYEAIKENGYQIFNYHKKDKKTFTDSWGGKYERTVQYKVDLRFYPGDQDVLHGDFEHGNFEFIHAFKWSDNDWGGNNLKEAFADDSKDDLICLPFIKISNNADADLCFQVTSITNSEIKVYTKAKFKFKGDKKSIEIGTLTVPAPFGYLADVSDMKEDKMQDLEEKIQDLLSDFLPVDGDFIEVLQTITPSGSDASGSDNEVDAIDSGLGPVSL